MRRRQEMQKEIEQHERERIQTARPGELDVMVPSPPTTCVDGNILVRMIGTLAKWLGTAVKPLK